MGHQRIGRLPLTARWLDVIELLTEAPDPAAIAGATLHAAQRRLDNLANEAALPYCFWLLVRIAAAAHEGALREELTRLRLPLRDDDALVGTVARIADDVFDDLMRTPGEGPFAELAVHSFQTTLIEIVERRGHTMFGSGFDDFASAMARHGTERGFGELATLFFADFVGRTLKYFLDREVGNRIHPESGLTSISDARECVAAVERHAREMAEIVRTFSGEWFSKHNYLADDNISRGEARGFVGYAMTKVRGELMLEVQPV
jgi:hypothetical protein